MARPSESTRKVVGLGFLPEEARHGFLIDIPKGSGGSDIICITEHRGNDLDHLGARTVDRPSPNDGSLRVVIDRNRWVALAPAFWNEANRRLRANGLPVAKFIKNPIYTSSYTLLNTPYGGRTYAILGFSQKLNGDSAEILGLEAAYRQQFDFLPGLWSGFGIEANVTFIDSDLTVPGRVDPAAFPEQSELLFGAQLFYQKGPIEASIAYHHTGRALISLGTNTLTDQHNDDLRRLDAKASFAITENIKLFFEAQNLTDEPTRQYQGERRDWVIQNERYGRTFYAGASVRF